MGKKSSAKADEKKRLAKEREARAAPLRAAIKAANAVADPTATLAAPLLEYRAKPPADASAASAAPPLVARVRFARTEQLSSAERDAMWALFEANMAEQYRESEWGWKPKEASDAARRARAPRRAAPRAARAQRLSSPLAALRRFALAERRNARSYSTPTRGS